MSAKHNTPKSVNTAVNRDYEAPEIPLPEDVLDPEKKHTRLIRVNFSEAKNEDK